MGPQNLTHIIPSPDQIRLWIVAQQDKENPGYNMPLTYRFQNLDYNLLKNTLNIILHKHLGMFSVFKNNEGTPYIDILPHEVNLEHIDLSKVASGKDPLEVLKYLGQEIQKPFNLETGPLFRFLFIKQNDSSYYFHATIHHIIFDGTSINILLRELNLEYNRLLQGQQENSGSLPAQSFELSDNRVATDYKPLVDFWQQYLSGSQPDLKIVSDFPRKSNYSGIGGREHFILSAAASQQLRNLSIQTKTSLFKTVLSTLGIFFQKYTGDHDLSMGIPISKRRLDPRMNELLGFFVNTTVVRLNKDLNRTFSDFISYANESVNQAIKNAGLPYDHIVEAVNPDRTVNQLYNLSVSWFNDIYIPLILNGYSGERLTVPESVAADDLTFYIWENGENLCGDLEYNSELFTRETIVRIKNHYLSFIENLTSQPNNLLNDIPVLSQEEFTQIEQFNQTQTDYPKHKTLIELFEKQAASTPEKTAVVFKDESLTYRELNEKANQIGRTLRKQGVKPNGLVGIMSDKSIDLMAGILGILKSGAAYLPIDPEYPSERINFILQDSGCSCILTQKKYAGSSIQETRKYYLEDPELYDSDSSNIENINKPDDLAYIIYTSGTTGTPKGSLIPHQGVVRLVCNTNYIRYTLEDNVSQASAIVFDASTEEIFGALLHGSTLYVIDKETLLDPEAYGDILINQKITIVDLTSALFTQLAESRIEMFKSVKYLLLGGDVISAPHVTRLRKAVPGIKVLNCYGPTENSCNSTYYLVEKDFESNVPIGKPISNSTAFVLDQNLRYQPIGVIGELYVGGDGLSKGYLNREDLNKKVFLHNPYHPEERIYKTGDLARWLPDGNLEFHGRMDNQIKIRGYRVELEEIESVIASFEGVVESVIKPVKLDDGDYKLVAFINISASSKLDSKEIERAIKAKLPPYMVPSLYKFMHGFPKNVSGKIDRKALTFDPEELSRAKSSSSDIRSNTEEKLNIIWKDLLKTGDIAVDDNFFDVGGNSLIAIRLINTLKESFRIQMTFRDLSQNPTIRELGSFIDSIQQGTDEFIQLTHIQRTFDLPLTNNQKRLWFISRLDPEKASYIISLTYHMKGKLYPDLLNKSFEILFNRHHIVFSRMKEKDGQPVCDIIPHPIHIHSIDFSTSPESERKARVRDQINEDSRQVFNLENGPLFRVYLMKNSDQEHYLHLSIHHIVFDGWSHDVLLNEFSEIYNSLVKNKDPQLSNILFQQYDYAALEAGRTEKAESLTFWKSNLEGCSSMLNFPYDYKRKEKSTGRGSVETIVIDKSLSEKLRDLSKNKNHSLFATIAGLMGLQMHIYTGENDLNIGLPLDFRPHSSLENIFGMFVNTVVLRFQYEKGLTFRQLLQQSADATMNAVAHQDLPFERVVEIIKPERIAAANPLFQVALAWQNYNGSALTLEGLSCENIKRTECSPIFDITFYLGDNGEHIEGEIEYNTDLLTRDTILRLKENFICLIQAVTSAPDQDIDELSILNKQDEALIFSVNETDTPYEKDICIHRKFEQQVLLTPDAPALMDQSRTFSYSDFNSQANRLANYLIASGLKVEDKVAVCIDRSIEMMVSILAILKAGGAYVPLNPENPADRLKSILEEAQPRFILSSKTASGNIPTGESYLLVDDMLTNPLHELDKNPKVEVSPKNLAYVLYTSGSTGKPKGVMIEHHSVLNRLGWMQKAYPIDKQDTLLQKTPITFDVSVWELFWWFFNGAKLVLLPKGGEKDPEELLQCIDKFNVTTIHFVPSMFASFLDTAATKELYGSMKSLTRIFLSGEALPLKMVQEFNARRNQYILPDLINLYGPTEATVDVSYYNCPRSEVKNVFIGKPIDNTKLFVVNPKNKIRPIGIPGELLITGVNLARGYLNRPDLTNERFIDFEISKGNIIKAYRTGDLVRMTAEGEIDYMGRLDNQVKIRGFRIELGDIEAKLLSHPAVTNCAVIVEDKGDYKFLCAYVCLKPGESSSADQLKSYLSGKLPDYMVPSFILMLPELPLTSSGKLNRKSLPKIDQLIQKEPIILPTNQVEITLITLWKNLLKVESLGINDNFFDIGGNSILAITLANAISKEFNTPVKPLFIFEYTRIKEQAAFLSNSKEDKLIEELNEIEEKNQKRKNINFKRNR